MRKELVRWFSIAVVCALTVGASSAVAQVAPWRLVQGSDGVLYLLDGNNTRFTVSPDPISDDELGAMADGGQLGGQLPMPPVPPAPAAQQITIIVTATPIPPTRVPAPVPTSTPEPTSPPAAAPQPVVVSGSGNQNSSPFTLRAGNHAILWSATAPGGQFVPGFTSIRLYPVDPNSRESSVGIASLVVNSGETKSANTNAYNLRGGQYYLTVSASGSWKVTFTPQ